MSTSTAQLITSLLNTLHSHLHSQSALLPGLIHQLGLPSSALESELDTLRTKLVASVDAQVDVRRGQVEEWMEKCDGVEGLCIKYSNALGGNVKSAGSTVGEIRKEQVLPKRYELAIEFQEKLRQASALTPDIWLYHTKLEHLTTLLNRLANLSRILGPDFYPSDITEPALALGESPDNDSSADLIRDVTPERFMRLEKELVRGKAEVSKRLTQLSQTFVQIDWLYTELGMVPPYTSDDEDLSNPPPEYDDGGGGGGGEYAGSSLLSEDPFATSTPTPASRMHQASRKKNDFLLVSDLGTPPPSMFNKHKKQTDQYERIFARFVLSVPPEEEQDPPSLDHLGIDPTPGLLSWATSLQGHLTDLKRHREAHIQTLYDQLEALWRRCGPDVISDEEMDDFVDSNRGSTEEVVKAYEMEVERMMEVKRERMGLFVESAREDIRKLWEDLMSGEEEVGAFVAMGDDEHTEELLSIHEEEIKRLKEERRLKAPLLSSIKKYFEICEEEQELALAASDQTRLLGRGRADPGRLLREEKMRRRVNKEKPRLEQDLLSTIPVWERETGMEFLVYGQSMLALLREAAGITAEQENLNNAANAKRKAAGGRAGSQPPPSSSSSTTTTRSGTLHTRSISGGAVTSTTGSRSAPSSRTNQQPTAGGGLKRTASNNIIPAAGGGAVTPAVRPRPGSAMSMASNKRPRIDHGESAVPPVPTLPTRGGGGHGSSSQHQQHQQAMGRSRPGSPSKIPNSHNNHHGGNHLGNLNQRVVSTSSSSTMACGGGAGAAGSGMSVSKTAALGPGGYHYNSRSVSGKGGASAIGMGVPSALKKAGNVPNYGATGGGGYGMKAAAAQSQQQQQQARLKQSQSQQQQQSRHQRQPKRESFKPRPSCEYDASELVGLGSTRRFGGGPALAPGRVDEEDEDEY